MIKDIEELEKMDASDTYPRRIYAKEVFISKKKEEFILPIGDGTAKLLGRDNEFPEPGNKLFKAKPTESQDYAEARRDFWSIQGDVIHRHHHEPRVQLYVPKEETFPIPHK